jgi:Zn-dependent M28 family amino/carboxypeptidase
VTKRPAVLAIVPAVVLAVAALAAQQARPSTLFDSAQLLKDLQTLSSDAMEGRLVGTPGNAKARGYIIDRLRAAGVQPIGDSFEKPFTFRSGRGGGGEERTGVNVVARIAGTKVPDRHIVITAHYDHLGVRNGEIFNGADDNASGTAALLALAAHFAKHPPAHSLIFAALDAEEGGLRGARAFVEAPPVPATSLALNINMDMIGRDPDDKLYVVGTFTQPYLKPIIEQIAAGAPVTLLMGHDNPNEKGVEDWTGSSDHAAFCRASIPCLYFGVEDFPQHHKATDDYETMTHDFYVRVVETMVAAVKAFDARLGEVVNGRGGR